MCVRKRASSCVFSLCLFTSSKCEVLKIVFETFIYVHIHRSLIVYKHVQT